MSAPPQPQRFRFPRKLAALLVVVAVAGTLYLLLRDQLTLESLVRRETQLRAYYQQHPLQLWIGAFVVYVAITGFSMPGAWALSVVCGWLFGFWQALLLVSFASTMGATVAFLLSRYFLHDWVQSHFSRRLARLNAALARDGAFYLLILRLLPTAPYFVINLVMGLTPLRARTFWWVSQLGMLPMTCVFVNAGASLPKLTDLVELGIGGILTPRLVAGLLLLGLIPLAIRGALRWYGRRSVELD
jgi:uncharacterized membrane protein YdjX (TVP38/TMEM64 family)